MGIVRGGIDSILEPFCGSAAVGLQGDAAWDARGLITDDANRWSERGEPTVYLATDIAVALAELARHLSPGDGNVEGSIWTMAVDLAAVVDLRDPRVRRRLSVSGGRTWALDPSTCRTVAHGLRRHRVQAILVPSVAFLDRPDRGNLILFAEHLPPGLDGVISDPRRHCVVAGGSPQPLTTPSR